MMAELLTTEEAAFYLRLSERKLYDLVASGAVPCTKVTGKWLFPKAALDRWLAAGLVMPALAHAPAPAIVGGSHDPLLEWALRRAARGSPACRRKRGRFAPLERGEVAAAAIHLHRLDGDDEAANVEAVADAPGLRRVVIAFARRERLVVAAGNPSQLRDVAGIACPARAFALRPQGAGALLLLALVARAGWRSISWPWSSRLPDRRRIAQACARAEPIAASRRARWRRRPPSISCRSPGALRPRCASATISARPAGAVQFVRSAAFRDRAAELAG
jgi:excisionase family DNA binding protein